MIICISGLSGSGKTTTAALLAKELKIRHVNRSYKEFTGDNENLIGFDKNVKHSFDLKFDKEVIKEANKYDSVVSTSLGPWIISNSTLNVWLEVGLDARAKRKAKDRRVSLKQAKKYVKEKDAAWVNHVKKAYGIDIIKDHDVFDVKLNGEKLSKGEIVTTIAMLSLAKDSKRFR